MKLFTLLLLGFFCLAAPAARSEKCTVSYPNLLPRTWLERKVDGFASLLTGETPFRGDLPVTRISWMQMQRLVLGNGFDPANIFLGLHEKHGPIAYSILPHGDPILFISDPKIIDAVLRETKTGSAGHGMMERDPIQSRGGARVFGTDTISTGNGPGWKEQRDVITPNLKKSAVESPENYGKMAEVFDRRIAELKQRIGRGETVNIQQEIHHMLLESQLQALFHLKPGQREIEDKLAPALAEAGKWLLFDTALNQTPLDLMKVPSFFPAQAKAKEAMQTVFSLVDRMIAEHQANPREDIVGNMLKDEKPGDRERTRRLIALIVVASADVATSYGTWPIDAMSRDPKMAQRVRDELGTKTLQPGDATPHVDAVLTETLRFYTPFYFLMRRAPVDMTITTPDGKTLTVPAGTHLAFSTLASHRAEENWGVAQTGFPANEFNPNRWLPENPQQPDERNLCAFGAGAHHCPGMVFAKAEVRLLFSKMMQNFDFAPVSNQPTRMSSGVATTPAGGGLTVQLKPR